MTFPQHASWFFYITQYVFQQLPEEQASTCCIHLWVTHVDDESDTRVLVLQL